MELMEFYGSCLFLIRAGKGSSFCFDDGYYITLERESSSDSYSCTPVSCSPISGLTSVDNVISLIMK